MTNAKAGLIRVRNKALRRRAVIYVDANLPDVATDLDTPHLSVMHQTMFDLVRQHYLTLGRAESNRPFVFLDIGSGTGAESIPILKEFSSSRVVAFDLADAVHTKFRENARKELGKQAAIHRCKHITGDITSKAGNPRALLQPLRVWGIAGRYDLIITAMTLHHFTTAEKQRVYRRVASVLAPGGLFINGDLFTYASQTMARMASDFGVNWIRKQFTDPDPHLKEVRNSLGNRADSIMNAWIEHCENHNRPEPVESAGGLLKEGKKIVGQAQMLIDAGFAEVACPFRYWGIGVLWAKR